MGLISSLSNGLAFAKKAIELSTEQQLPKMTEMGPGALVFQLHVLKVTILTCLAKYHKPK